MKTCKKCSVTVRGSFDRCPLCQNVLPENNKGGEDVFPFIPIVKYEHNMLYRIIQLFSVLLVIGSVSVNLMFPGLGFWSLFVLAGVACLWIIVSTAVRKRHTILKNMSYQVTIISILSLFWDVFTGWKGWSIDFVIPITFVSAMSATPIISRVLKIQTGTFIIYLFLLILYGIIPASFVLCGWSNVTYPSVICVAGSLVSLAALFIFKGKNMIAELKRRLHL